MLSRRHPDEKRLRVPMVAVGNGVTANWQTSAVALGSARGETGRTYRCDGVSGGAMVQRPERPPSRPGGWVTQRCQGGWIWSTSETTGCPGQWEVASVMDGVQGG